MNYPDDIRNHDAHNASPFNESDEYEPDYGDIVDMICSTYQPELCRIVELMDCGMRDEAFCELISIIEKCKQNWKKDER